MASLVMGICALATAVLGIVFAPLAILFGIKARRRIRDSGGRLEGGGMALSGIIMGAAWVVMVPVLIVMASVVFVLVQGLGEEATVADHTVEIDGDASYLQAFELHEASEVAYGIDGHGDGVYAVLVRVADPMDPVADFSETWAEGQGTTFSQSVVLEPGSYGLHMECVEWEPCEVGYRLELRPVQGSD